MRLLKTVSVWILCGFLLLSCVSSVSASALQGDVNGDGSVNARD